MQRQPQHQPPQHLYHRQPQAPSSYATFAYHQLPVTPGDFGPADDGSGGVVAAGALPSPPYMCSPQQSNADLGYSLSPESATFPLHIVNEQGFGQGRAPVRSASNGSTWSAGSSAAGGSAGVQPDRTHVTSGVSSPPLNALRPSQPPASSDPCRCRSQPIGCPPSPTFPRFPRPVLSPQPALPLFPPSLCVTELR